MQRISFHLAHRLLCAVTLCTGAALTLVGGSAQADIYRKIDSQGQMHLTDSPDGPGWVLVMRTKKPRARSSTGNGARARARAANLANLEKRRKQYSKLIDRAARKYRIDPALIHAVVQAESAYNSKAVSSKGAMGLMQLMPATAVRFGVTNAYDPQQNVMAGTRYLRWLMDKFNNTYLALAGYNAGEQSVIKYGNKVPPYPETQNYVRKVHLFWKERRGKQAPTTRAAAATRQLTTRERLDSSKKELEAARKEMRESLARNAKELRPRIVQ